MTRLQAIRQAERRWGKRALVRVGESLSSPERRQSTHDRVVAIRARREAISAEIQARLNALDWYQALEAERRALYQELNRIKGLAIYHKFVVGKREIGCFVIQGEGDTWEEAFADADRKQKATA